jgi:hypothetical protein
MWHSPRDLHWSEIYVWEIQIYADVEEKDEKREKKRA